MSGAGDTATPDTGQAADTPPASSGTFEELRGTIRALEKKFALELPAEIAEDQDFDAEWMEMMAQGSANLAVLKDLIKASEKAEPAMAESTRRAENRAQEAVDRLRQLEELEPLLKNFKGIIGGDENSPSVHTKLQEIVNSIDNIGDTSAFKKLAGNVEKGIADKEGAQSLKSLRDGLGEVSRGFQELKSQVMSAAQAEDMAKAFKNLQNGYTNSAASLEQTKKELDGIASKVKTEMQQHTDNIKNALSEANLSTRTQELTVAKGELETLARDLTTKLERTPTVDTALKELIADIKKNFEEQAASLGNNVSSTQTALDRLTKALAEGGPFDTHIAGMESTAQAVHGQMEELKKQTGTLTTQSGLIATGNTTLIRVASTIGQEVTKLEKLIGNGNGNGNVSSSMTALNNTIAGIQNNMKALGDAHNSTSGAVNSAILGQAERSQLKSSIKNLEDAALQRETIETSLKSLLDPIENGLTRQASEELQAANHRVRTLEGELDDLRQKLAGAQALLRAAQDKTAADEVQHGEDAEAVDSMRGAYGQMQNHIATFQIDILHARAEINEAKKARDQFKLERDQLQRRFDSREAYNLEKENENSILRASLDQATERKKVLDALAEFKEELEYFPGFNDFRTIIDSTAQAVVGSLAPRFDNLQLDSDANEYRSMRQDWINVRSVLSRIAHGEELFKVEADNQDLQRKLKESERQVKDLLEAAAGSARPTTSGSQEQSAISPRRGGTARRIFHTITSTISNPGKRSTAERTESALSTREEEQARYSARARSEPLTGARQGQSSFTSNIPRPSPSSSSRHSTSTVRQAPGGGVQHQPSSSSLTSTSSQQPLIRQGQAPGAPHLQGVEENPQSPGHTFESFGRGGSSSPRTSQSRLRTPRSRPSNIGGRTTAGAGSTTSLSYRGPDPAASQIPQFQTRGSAGPEQGATPAEPSTRAQTFQNLMNPYAQSIPTGATQQQTEVQRQRYPPQQPTSSGVGNDPLHPPTTRTGFGMSSQQPLPEQGSYRQPQLSSAQVSQRQFEASSSGAITTEATTGDPFMQRSPYQEAPPAGQSTRQIEPQPPQTAQVIAQQGTVETAQSTGPSATPAASTTPQAPLPPQATPLRELWIYVGGAAGRQAKHEPMRSVLTNSVLSDQSQQLIQGTGNGGRENSAEHNKPLPTSCIQNKLYKLRADTNLWDDASGPCRKCVEEGRQCVYFVGRIHGDKGADVVILKGATEEQRQDQADRNMQNLGDAEMRGDSIEADALRLIMSGDCHVETDGNKIVAGAV